VDPVTWAIIGGGAGFFASIVWRRLDRRDDHDERRGERQMMQGELVAGILARLSVLEGDRGKCDALSERAAKLEAWRDMATPRIDEAHEGLRAVARLDERMKTLFTLVSKIERLVSHSQEAHHAAA
jgi:hypothetical protein